MNDKNISNYIIHSLQSGTNYTESDKIQEKLLKDSIKKIILREKLKLKK